MISPPRLTRVMTLVLLALGAAGGAAQAAESAYPTRPIRLLVPFPPGGSLDATARIIAPRLSDTMGQTWVVDNRGGAGGNLATEIAVRANPDGYTVLLAVSTQLTVNPSLYNKLPFDVERDLQPIIMLATGDNFLVVHPAVQAKTLKELVALAKQKPGAINYGSSGVGTVNHLAGELLKRRAGFDMVHVPYKGAGPAISAMLAGETEVNITSAASTIAHINAGRLRALSTIGAKRSKLLPVVPTVAESGYPGYEVTVWFALMAPVATPKIIVERIRNETLKALQRADVQAAMERVGLNAEASTQAELAERIKTEAGMWGGLIKDLGIRAE